MMHNILIIDTETTGIAVEKGAQIIEVGALLFSTREKVVLQTVSTFFKCDDNPVQDINHISPKWTQEIYDAEQLLKAIKFMAHCADYIVAHNAEFDKKFMRTIIKDDDEFWFKPWICTKKDFRWPVQLFRSRLQDICEAMQVPYVNAHRALTDCKFLADSLAKVPDLEERIQQAGSHSSRNKFNDGKGFK